MAQGRVERLLELAEQRTKEPEARSQALARRYAGIALKISEHYQVKIPKRLKHRICKNCHNLLVPGINCTVKVASTHGYVAYVCECGKESHLLYKPSRRPKP